MGSEQPTKWGPLSHNEWQTIGVIVGLLTTVGSGVAWSFQRLGAVLTVLIGGGALAAAAFLVVRSRGPRTAGAPVPSISGPSPISPSKPMTVGATSAVVPTITTGAVRGRAGGKWGEAEFREAMARLRTPRNVEAFDGLAERLSGHPRLELRFDGSGKDPTCKVYLKGTAAHVLWVYFDGRLNWCWESFRAGRPDVVALFQRLVGSSNESSQMWGASSLADRGPGPIIAILDQVARAAAS